MNGKRASFRRIYGAPTGIALVSLAGLTAALVVDGPADPAFAAAVGVPLAAAAWALLRRRS